MPTLGILDDEGRLRWDASCMLISTIMVPDDPALRQRYEATLRVEKAEALPDGSGLLTKRDHILTKSFHTRQRISPMMQTRRIHSVLAGAMLWDLHTAAAAQPELASKNKIEFTIDRLSIAADRIGSLATLRSAWRQFRPVIHWCAALAYQLRIFGSPFPQIPETEYVGDVVISDFLTLGETFLAFAKQAVAFPAGRRPSYWTTPRFTWTAPRHPDWPNGHILADGIGLGPEFLERAAAYVIEGDQVARKWLISGTRRRFNLAPSPPKRP